MKPILTILKVLVVDDLADYLLKVVLALYRRWLPCLVDLHPIDTDTLAKVFRSV